jgi:hypothetical protein
MDNGIGFGEPALTRMTSGLRGEEALVQFGQ